MFWERAMGSDDDPFADAAGARLSKASRHDYLFAWRRFLGFLATHDPTALELAPAERLTIERVRVFRVHLAETNTLRSVAIQVDAVYKAARIMMPEHDWTWLKAVKARLYRAAPSSAAMGPVITSVQLRELGEQLMDESKPNPNALISKKDAAQYRDGLIFALGASVPLRPKNLVALEIGRHLVRESDSWFIVIPGEEMKTGRAVEYPVAEFLEPYLATYLDIIRPRMLRDPTRAALWFNSRGGALAYAALGSIINQHSMARLGIRLTPHDVRDAAATTWAIFKPGQIGVARDLLGHSDVRTTTYYIRSRGIEVSRSHNQLIAAIRRKRHRRGGDAAKDGNHRLKIGGDGGCVGPKPK
jgi:integrase